MWQVANRSSSSLLGTQCCSRSATDSVWMRRGGSCVVGCSLVRHGRTQLRAASPTCLLAEGRRGRHDRRRGSLTLLEVYEQALSEHVFIVVVLLFVLAGEEHVRSPRGLWPLAALVALSWSAFYLRYAGIAFIGIAGLLVLMTGWRTRPDAGLGPRCDRRGCRCRRTCAVDDAQRRPWASGPRRSSRRSGILRDERRGRFTSSGTGWRPNRSRHRSGHSSLEQPSWQSSRRSSCCFVPRTRCEPRASRCSRWYSSWVSMSATSSSQPRWLHSPRFDTRFSSPVFAP